MGRFAIDYYGSQMRVFLEPLLSFCRHTSVKSKKVMASRIIQDYT